MDLESVARAKNYIDALANGIDPLSGEVISEREVVRQKRLVKCFQFISTVLSEVLENGGIQVEQAQRDPFNVENIDFSGFAYSETPITITDFVKRINACRPRTMQKTSYAPFLKWMEKNQILRKKVELEVKETSHYTVGEKAEEIGIFEETRENKRGSYSAVLYSAQAQHFLISRLADIQNNKLLANENSGKRWNREEEWQLLVMWEKGFEISQMAEELHRSPYAIRLRLEKLFGEKAARKDLTDEEKKQIDALGRRLSGKE